jgi:hypothetical protein
MAGAKMGHLTKSCVPPGYESESLDDAILDVGERLTSTAYEKYTDGRVDLEQLLEVYKILSEWTAKSELLLRLTC